MEWLRALFQPPARLELRRRGLPSGVPSEAEIEARVNRLAALGELPPGWSRRDAARLLRIEARRVALRRA